MTEANNKLRCSVCHHLEEHHGSHGCRVILARGPGAREFQDPHIEWLLCRCEISAAAIAVDHALSLALGSATEEPTP